MIRFVDITHLIGERELYSGLTWHIKPGVRVGLAGDNGTGKTTLLRMAAGEVEPTSGTISPRKGMRLGFLRQEYNDIDENATVLQQAMLAWAEEEAAQAELMGLYESLADVPESEHEEIFDRIHDLEKAVHHHDRGQVEAEACKILSGLGFSQEQMNQPLSAFSGGWQMRAHIARLLLSEPDVLMLDEPTNHLDLESIQWLEGFLSTFPGALVVVSHDRYFLDRITTETAWIHERRIDTYAHSYSGFLKERALHEELLQKRWKNQQDELAHHEQFIDRFRYKASKAAAVQSRIKMVDKIERVELPENTRKVRLRIPDPAPCARHVLDLDKVTKSYGDNHVLTNINLRFELGDKVALVGRNGAGKSTLLKICAGILDHGGKIERHSKARFEYFSQHRVEELNLDNDVLHEARPLDIPTTDEQLRTLLGCFLFSGDDVFKKVRVLSGGEKSRLSFAKLIMRRGNVLLLDEPTNHLDISTRETLQEALRDFPGTVIMISHDRAFIDGLATRIVEIANGEATNFHGNYSEFLKMKQDTGSGEENLRGRVAAPPKTESASGNGNAGGSAPKKTQENKKEKAKRRTELYEQFRVLELNIEKSEKRIAEIHSILASPDSYSNAQLASDLGHEAKELEKKLPTLVTEWETLGAEIEELKA